jgi:hypothetical protein
MNRRFEGILKQCSPTILHKREQKFADRNPLIGYLCLWGCCRIESTMPGCSGSKYVPRSCLTYEVAAGYFLNTNQVLMGQLLSAG